MEWFAVPCNVGDSKLRYSIIYMTDYWGLVIGNSRCVLSCTLKPMHDAKYQSATKVTVSKNFEL
jgi:hypothetical protein